MKTQHTIPVNKTAALFLSRKKRIESLQECLNVFAIAVCAPATVNEIAQLMRARVETNEAAALTITLKLRPDFQATNRIYAVMSTQIETEIGREAYGELRTL